MNPNRFKHETLECTGPCQRVAVDLSWYSPAALRKFRASGRCVMCGDGAEYLPNLCSGERPHKENAMAPLPFNKQLRAMKYNDHHPRLYTALTARCRISKTLYRLHKRCDMTNDAEDDGADYEEQDESAEDNYDDAVSDPIVDFAPDDAAADDIAEPIDDDVERRFEKHAGEADDEDPIEDDAPEETHNFDKTPSNKRAREPEPGLGKCCFCGGECNECSQACGSCARNATRRAQQWSKFGGFATTN